MALRVVRPVTRRLETWLEINRSGDSGPSAASCVTLATTPMSSPELESPESDRLRRLEALDELLPTLAGVLDIREVFERMSAIAMTVLPHDMMSLPLLAENGRDVVVYAVAGTTVQFPKTVPLADEHRPLLTEPWEFFLFDDLLQDPVERSSHQPAPDSARCSV